MPNWCWDRARKLRKWRSFVKSGDNASSNSSNAPGVTPIESPTGLDLHPEPDEPIRVSRRAGLGIVLVIILLLAAFAYGGYRRAEKVEASSRERGIPKALTPATA